MTVTFVRTLTIACYMVYLGVYLKLRFNIVFTPWRRSRFITLLILNLAMPIFAPGIFNFWARTLTPHWNGLQRRNGHCGEDMNFLPLSTFESQIFQPVTYCCTNCTLLVPLRRLRNTNHCLHASQQWNRVPWLCRSRTRSVLWMKTCRQSASWASVYS